MRFFGSRDAKPVCFVIRRHNVWFNPFGATVGVTTLCGRGGRPRMATLGEDPDDGFTEDPRIFAGYQPALRCRECAAVAESLINAWEY